LNRGDNTNEREYYQRFQNQSEKEVPTDLSEFVQGKDQKSDQVNMEDEYILEETE
jgi:hypothetical protein